MIKNILNILSQFTIKIADILQNFIFAYKTWETKYNLTYNSHYKGSKTKKDKLYSNKFSLNLIFILAGFFLLVACKPNLNYNTDPNFSLRFSQDTIIFDTLFTTIGSTTHRLKVYNESKQEVKIEYIALADAKVSNYAINIDGEPTDYLKDVILAAEDSMYLFVEVRIDPTNQNNPMIITDSILFSVNGKVQDVDLVAWGQDAHFIVGDANYGGFSYLGNQYSAFGEIVAHENEVIDWIDDKPYVVYGFAIIDSAATLNIHEGVDIYFHKNSGIWVYKGGQIEIMGTKDSLVSMQGDRLEDFYYDAPGQWFGFFLNESYQQNKIHYAVIRNSINGIHYEPHDIQNIQFDEAIEISNTIVDNSSYTSLFSMTGSINSINSVYGKAGKYSLFLGAGGNYDFRHCTFSNHWAQGVRNDPAMVISNYMLTTDTQGNGISYLGNLEKAYFGNCILEGSLEDEILLAKTEDEAIEFKYSFDHSLLKTKMVLDEAHFSNCIVNKDPLFSDIEYFDYSLDTIVSPAVNMGNISVINESLLPLENDYNGNSRLLDEAPDMGAYEFVEQ